MKSTLFTLVAVALLGLLLAYTNPTLDSYQEFVHQSILQETKHQENPLEQVLGSLLGGVASGMIVNQLRNSSNGGTNFGSALTVSNTSGPSAYAPEMAVSTNRVYTTWVNNDIFLRGAARQTSPGPIEYKQENFIWPIEVPTFSGTPPNDYATFGVGKQGYFHAGVDIKSSNLPLDKTRVKAIANGIIEKIFRTSDTTTRCDGVTPFVIRTDNHGFGNTIILKHSDKLYSLYAHLHCVESKLEKGTNVSQGEPIGLMGNSAYEKRECNPESDCNPQSTEDRGFGKHLHLEIKKRGILTNPDGPADQYFAYTKVHPDKYGYLDPKKIIGPWPSTAAAGETVQFLSLVEGSPGVPGDGVIIRDDGEFPFFDIQPGFSLRGVTNGITISVFPGVPIFHLPNTGNFNIGLQINFGVEGKPLTQCSIGSGVSEVLTPTVNGAQGIAGIFSQSRLSDLVDQVRRSPLPGCEAVSLDQFFIHNILMHVPFGDDHIHQVDALAIGIGENVFPTKDTLTE